MAIAIYLDDELYNIQLYSGFQGCNQQDANPIL